MGDGISIIIPAWNEAALLATTLTHIQRVSKGLPIDEIIVVDNNSTDDTAQIAQRCGATVVHEPYNQIARARNTGARHACGTYLFFIDADTWPSAEILQAGYRVLQAGAVGIGSVVCFEGEVSKGWRGLARFWNMISVHFKLAAGSFVLCPKEVFDAVGGFPCGVYAGEEVLFSKKIQKYGALKGQKMHIFNSYPITTSARKCQGGSSLSTLVQTMLIFMCPALVRWRCFCWLWYRNR